MSKLNYGIYGERDDWVYLTNKAWGNNLDDEEVPIEESIALANFGDVPDFAGDDIELGLWYYRVRSTISTGVINDKLKLNQHLDKSICPIGTDSGFTGIRKKWVTKSVNDNLIEIKSKPSVHHPLFFYTLECYYGGDGYKVPVFAPNDVWYNSPQWWGYRLDLEKIYKIGISSISCDDYAVQPVVQMPIKKVVWCIFVHAKNKKGEDRYYDLKTYVTDKTAYTSFPNIDSVYVSPRIQAKIKLPRGHYEGEFPSTLSFEEINPHFEKTDIYDDNNTPFSYEFLKYRNRVNDTKSNVYYTLDGETKNYGKKVSLIPIFGVSSGGLTSVNYRGNLILGDPEFLEIRDGILESYSTLAHFGGLEGFWAFFMKQCAYLGMFFTDDLYVADYGKDIDDNMYLGKIDSSGITHGEYTKGEENAKQPQYDWEDFVDNDIYDPNEEPDQPDPNEYDDSSLLPQNTAPTGINAFTTTYAINNAGLRHLSEFLYNTLLDEYAKEDLTLTELEGKLRSNFLTANPIDCIVSLMSFPLQFKSGSTTPFVIGNSTVKTSQGTTIYVRTQPHGSLLLDGGSCTYHPHFKDFRDYEPYTKADLYIPYCGSIGINPSEFMGHTISLKYAIDLITGACMCFIYRDGLIVNSLEGQVGTQISISGIQSSDYNNALYGTLNNYNQSSESLQTARVNQLEGTVKNVAGTVASTVTGFALGGVPGAVAGFAVGATGSVANQVKNNNTYNIAQMQHNKSQYDLQHVQTPYKTTGTSSPITSMRNEQSARLILTRPVMIKGYDSTKYADTIGFACHIENTIGKIKGYSEFANANLNGIPCTLSEKNEISALLTGGVYL